MGSWPEINDQDYEAVMRVLERGVLTGPGPECEALEREWAGRCGTKHCIAVNGGTSAIHIVLAWLGVGPGDEVVMPAFSYCGTYQPVLALGAVPVFVDVLPDTFNMDPDALRHAVTTKTEVILPVHIHGLPADMGAIMDVAQEADLPVVEDACQAHGAAVCGRIVGAIGVAGCFSLNATKTLPAGEGGLLTTDDDDLARFARSFRYTGEDLDQPAVCGVRPNLVTQRGLNYLLPEMPAALARSQLTRLDERIARARECAAVLTRALMNVDGLHPPVEWPADAVHIYHKYRLRFDPLNIGSAAFRNGFVSELQDAGVPATLWEIKPLPADPVFERLGITTHPIEVRNAFPHTSCLLLNSLIIGDEQHPLCVQMPEMVSRWAAIITEVWNGMS